MRIVQIIDSLEAGGAERMAVNYANALSATIPFSALVATRKEGTLKNYLDPRVNYLFLKKKKTFDITAIMTLRSFCKQNEVEFLHAHSTSYLLAVMVKCLLPKLKIIWHDHNGMSEFLRSRDSFVLKFASLFFSGIIVVNKQLKDWAQKELSCKNIIYLTNFTYQEAENGRRTELKGQPGKRILCLANLRFQKNHMLLLEVAAKLRNAYPDWTYHLVGKDFEDDYSAEIFATIEAQSLQNTVFVYGTRNDTTSIIAQSNIAVLTSQSEGLPVSLLDYGLGRKAVVVTKVGEISEIIEDGKNGFIVPSANLDAFCGALAKLMDNTGLISVFGEALYYTITEKHSEKAVISRYCNWADKL
jgi:glycosyltransferase involved in cell wall biosynthesis